MTLVAIRSVQFPNRYVRLDGQGVSTLTGPGGGKVNTQTFIGTYETFILQLNDDKTVSFGSTVFKDVFIRMSAAGVPQGENVTGGGGTVNGQFTARTLERFHIHQKADAPGQYKGVVGIESVESPGRFLRLDGNAGLVNVQGVFKTYEEFEILVVG
ncbi:hypothetical protein GALMADRAFT_1363997 [Galerina marginata CBS 339.88]|uniref:Uncharacterized protein n=1 Tax=Galerina marginata (strain CBS 339.88) TaxID=685588 RepID=A0A067TB11_GALM3|nr:hypothetical protein GALMADRAFT_1363997 [Galerina marginata CBS 339.88]